MHGLVALENLDGILDFEPLAFPADAQRIFPVVQNLGDGQDVHVGSVLAVLVLLEDAEEPAQLPLDSRLFVHLPDRRAARLLLGLHAPAGHDPAVGVAAAAHQQHLVLALVAEAQARRPLLEALRVVGARLVRLALHPLGRRAARA